MGATPPRRLTAPPPASVAPVLTSTGAPCVLACRSRRHVVCRLTFRDRPLAACPRTSHRKRRPPEPSCCVLSRPRTDQYGGSLRPCLPVPAPRRLPVNVP